MSVEESAVQPAIVNMSATSDALELKYDSSVKVSVAQTSITSYSPLTVKSNITVDCNIILADSLFCVDADADDATADSRVGRLVFGAGSDLNIYHGGTNSYLVNKTGDLIIMTDGSGSGIILDSEDDTLEIKYSGTVGATFSTTGLNLASGDYYSINGTSVLNATTLGSGITSSSLTSVGTLSSLTTSGNVTLNAASELRYADSDSSNYVGFKSAGTVASNVIWTLPSSDGSSDQVLTTDGSGTLSWSDGPSSTATNVTASANNSTDETTYLTFVDGATGTQGIETDTGLTYNPSSGLLTTTSLAGTLTTAAQTNVTSLGTLTSLTVDSISIDGTTIGHTSDTDLITLGDRIVTVSGNLVVNQNLIVSGNSIIANTDSIHIEDSIIVLGNGVTGSPIWDGGFIVNRGSSNNAAFFWDESQDRFVSATTTSSGGEASPTVSLTAYADAAVKELYAGTTKAIDSNGLAVVAAQTNITSVGTLTSLTVDNIIINGTTIGHTSDTDLMTLTDQDVYIRGDLQVLVPGGSSTTYTNLKIHKSTNGGYGYLEIGGNSTGGAHRDYQIGWDSTLSYLYFGDYGTSNGGGTNSSEEQVRFYRDAPEQSLVVNTGELVINEGSNDYDFRVETNGNTHGLYVDGGNDRVGICNSSPSVALDVTGAITSSGVITGSSLVGTLTTAAQTNVTSLGTLTALTVDNVSIDDSSIEHGSNSSLYINDTNTATVGIYCRNDLRIRGTGSSFTISDRNSASGNTVAWTNYTNNSGISENRYYYYSQIATGGTVGNVGWISNAGSNAQINFTAQHKCVPKDESKVNEYKNKKGYIVVSSGEYYNMFNIDNENDPTKIQISECLPTFELSSSINDKNVFGVIGGYDERTTVTDINGNVQTVSRFGWGSMNYGSNGEYTVKERFRINSGGEGAIMVSNYSSSGTQPIQKGDYITTSPIEGIGMKQSDDVLHNYTVAKALNDEDFTSDYTEITYNSVTYRFKLIGCTYHCG